jgi:hypothetical protein
MSTQASAACPFATFRNRLCMLTSGAWDSFEANSGGVPRGFSTHVSR